MKKLIGLIATGIILATSTMTYGSDLQKLLQRVGYSGNIEQLVGNNESIKKYLGTKNGKRLKFWIGKTPEREEIIYAEGRGEGVHFREIVSEGYEKFLDSNTQDGPKNFPENYGMKQIK